MCVLCVCNVCAMYVLCACHSVCVPCAFYLCAMCVPCMCYVCAIYVLCVCDVCTMCVPCVCHVCAMCVLCMCYVCAMCVLCVLCMCYVCAIIIMSCQSFISSRKLEIFSRDHCNYIYRFHHIPTHHIHPTTTNFCAQAIQSIPCSVVKSEGQCFLYTGFNLITHICALLFPPSQPLLTGITK